MQNKINVNVHDANKKYPNPGYLTKPFIISAYSHELVPGFPPQNYSPIRANGTISSSLPLVLFQNDIKSKKRLPIDNLVFSVNIMEQNDGGVKLTLNEEDYPIREGIEYTELTQLVLQSGISGMAISEIDDDVKQATKHYLFEITVCPGYSILTASSPTLEGVFIDTFDAQRRDEPPEEYPTFLEGITFHNPCALERMKRYLTEFKRMTFRIKDGKVQISVHWGDDDPVTTPKGHLQDVLREAMSRIPSKPNNSLLFS